MAREYGVHGRGSAGFKTMPTRAIQVPAAGGGSSELASTPPAPAAGRPKARAAGLSKPHTNTNPCPSQNVPPASCSITYYKGAALVDIKGPPTKLEAPPEGGKRGEIKGMSSASRSRLKQRLAMVLNEERANGLAVCLTYPRDVVKPEEWETYKYHLRVFNQAVGRKYEGSSGIWVLEFQKSGAPHFHLLVFGMKGHDIKDLREWMQAKWYAIAHNGDKHLGRAGTSIEWVKSGGGVMGYMAKYMSKAYQANRGGHTGRMWGKFGPLPLGEAATVELTSSQSVKVLRWARKKMEVDMNDSRWRAFFNNQNPRKPCPLDKDEARLKRRVRKLFPDMMPTERAPRNPHLFGGRIFWETAKSAFHGGAKSFSFVTKVPCGTSDGMAWDDYWSESAASCSIIRQYRPPSKWKARTQPVIRLICDTTAFTNAVKRAMATGLLDYRLVEKPLEKLAERCNNPSHNQLLANNA